MQDEYKKRDIFLRRLAVDRTHTKIELGDTATSEEVARRLAFKFAKRGKDFVKGRGLMFVADSHHPATTVDKK